MANRIACGDAPPAMAEANLAAFFRNRADVPVSCCAALTRSLSRLCGSDDPVVTFRPPAGGMRSGIRRRMPGRAIGWSGTAGQAHGPGQLR
jgi:hypothetical protein